MAQQPRKSIVESMASVPPQHFDDVSLRWLLAWGTVVLGAALLCVYLTLCLLFYQGEWQLVFHPSAAVNRTPATHGLAFQDVRFNADETGHLRLNGWWIPATVPSTYPNATLLYCHRQTGSLSDSLDQLTALHALGINVFAFDYRGYGKSDFVHPSEARVYDDASAAVRYLTETRRLPPSSIIVAGEDLGANIAAHTISANSALRALIAINPVWSQSELLAADHRTHLFPSFLVQNRMELTAALSPAPQPTLFLLSNNNTTLQSRLRARTAGNSTIILLPGSGPPWQSPVFPRAIRQFLDEYLPQP